MSLRALTQQPGGGGGAVDSVNGQTGVVVLDIDDIGGVVTDGVTITGDGTSGDPLVAVTGGGGTVQTVDIATANGFAGTSDGDPTDPVLTITTTLGAGEVPVSNGTGFQSAPVTGAGNIVLSGSPTLTTPNIGAATGTSLLLSGTISASNFSGSSSGTNTGDQTNITGNAGTVTFVDAGGDTTCFVALGTSATGSLSPATDAGITYNATTNALTTTTFIGALTGNADTATTATNAVIANEATDTTCFVNFTTAATGNLGIKSNASLTYNSNTGALGATTFNGVALVTGGSPSAYLSQDGTYSTPAGSGQTSIQFKDDGSNLGSSGTADTVDFTGSGVTASRVGNVVTVNVAGGGGSGDVTGPASSTDNAIVRFDGLTGKIIQDYTSGAPTIGDTGAAVFNSTVGVNGAVTITSNSANALAVGPNGATNPAFSVDASASSLDNGYKVFGGSTSVTMNAVGNDTNISAGLSSKGSGNVTIAAGTSGAVLLAPAGATRYTIESFQHLFTAATQSTATNVRYSWVGAADTSLTAGTESPSVYFNSGQTRTHASNTIIALQRDIRVTGSTHAFASSGGVITDCAAFSVDGPDSGGTNATLTNSHGVYLPTRAVSNVTNAYGLTVAAPTGAGTLNLAINATGTSRLGTVQNTRFAKRVVTVNAAGATPTTNTDNCDIAAFTGLATAITSMTTNLSGTPVAGDMIMFQFTDDGTARGITWGASFSSTTVTLPTTTVISTLLRVLFQRNTANTGWDCIAVV